MADSREKNASHQVRIPREQPVPHSLWTASNVATRHHLQLLAALPTLVATQQHHKLALIAQLLMSTMHSDAFSPQTTVCQLQTRTTFAVRSQHVDRTLREQQRYREVLRCAAEALIHLIHPAQHHAVDQFFRRTEPLMLPGRFGALRDLHDGIRFPSRRVEAAALRAERAALALQLGNVRDAAGLVQDARSTLPSDLAEIPQLMIALGLAQQHIMLCTLRSLAVGQAAHKERPSKRQRHARQTNIGADMQPFGHQRGLWRANEADTVWIEATRHLKEALQVLHHATYARLQLVQLQACAGRAQQAATTTHAAPDAAPFDADAWGLRALGLQAEGSAAIEHCCIEILRCDPGAVEALQVLRLSNPNLTIWIEGLLLHLDAPWTTLRASAWQWLADALDMWAGGPSNASSTRAEELLRARHWWEAVHFASPWATQQAGMEGGAGHCVDTDKARVAAYICGPTHAYVEAVAGLCSGAHRLALRKSVSAAQRVMPGVLYEENNMPAGDNEDGVQWVQSQCMGMLWAPPRSWWRIFAQVRRAE